VTLCCRRICTISRRLRAIAFAQGNSKAEWFEIPMPGSARCQKKRKSKMKIRIRRRIKSKSKIKSYLCSRTDA